MGCESTLEVALVSVPFTPLHTPSLGLSLLHSGIKNLGLKCKTFYFGFRFAQLIGTRLYYQISDGLPYRWDLLGEWVFSGSLFEQNQAEAESYVRDVLRGGLPEHRVSRGGAKDSDEQWIHQVLNARDQAPSFLDSCASDLASYAPKVIGLTSMFQEHVPALALAKRLRKLLPDSLIVMGGSNCEGPMGVQTARSFKFLDAVVSGEADKIFPEMVDRALKGERTFSIRGVHQANRELALPILGARKQDDTIAEPVEDMDSLPWPDYDDYIEQVESGQIDFTGITSPHLVFETARGCWWGEKQHCTFCGLNGSTMAFRSKSAERALAELEYLVDRYPGRPVAVTDNILDYK